MIPSLYRWVESSHWKQRSWSCTAIISAVKRSLERSSRIFLHAWVGLIPVLPPLALLSLSQLPKLRQFPRNWQMALAFFAACQTVAAFLTPQPEVAVPVALLRVAYVIALLLSGFLLGETAVVRPALIGYAVVAVTAFITTLYLHPAGAFQVRLSHPYYTEVSLGLAGVLGLLLAVTWRGGPSWWRVIGGVLALGMFLWSGSRGPLIALVAGLLAASVVSLRTQWRAVLLTLMSVAALVFALQALLPTSVTTRFTENTLNGRGAYWNDAVATARAYPWGGVGPYRLGPYLSTQYNAGSCQFWLQNQVYRAGRCPAFIDRLRGTWLIAHNTAFHLLGETGVIGASGWLALMAALAVTAWRSRDPLVNALTWATAAVGLVDNPTLLPGLGFAEFYWLLSGTGIAMLLRQKQAEPEVDNRPALTPAAPLLALLLLGYFTLPLWLERVLPARPFDIPVLSAMTLPSRLTAGEPVTVFYQAKITSGTYLLRGLACPLNGETTCLNVINGAVVDFQNGWNQFDLVALPHGHYLLHLQLVEKRARLLMEPTLVELIRGIDVE
ncbi:O-antigen ligase family protein [Deinococcus sp. UYEF24]